MPVTSLGGNNYFVTLLDDHSKLSLVQPIARKSDAAAAVQSALNMLENQIDGRTKRLRCDNGSEYINAGLKAYCESKGIKLETTVRYTPEQNGAAERLNRTLMDKVRPMLTGAGLPKYLWAEAVVTANNVRNRSPVTGRDKTPWELFFGTKPDVSHLRIFGARVYTLTPKELRTKLESTSKHGRFIGYPVGTKGYKILLDTGRIIISRDVRFVEFDHAKQNSTEQLEADYTSEEEDHETEFVDVDMEPDNPRHHQELVHHPMEGVQMSANVPSALLQTSLQPSGETKATRLQDVSATWLAVLTWQPSRSQLLLRKLWLRMRQSNGSMLWTTR
jgi:hypothetical protein